MSAGTPTLRMRRTWALRADGRFRFLRFWTARIGVATIVAILLVALLGPLVAPHGPTDIVGPAFNQPGGNFALGTDFLGRDALSRVLYGGRTLIGLSLAATLVAYVIGLPAGLIAGYSRSAIDPILMRTMDVLLAFPPLLFLLVVATGAKNSLTAIVIAVGITSAPGLARIVRASVLDVAQRSYVEAAVARGESTPAIVRREILPNILGVLLADAGLRLTYSILLVAAVNFLGLGLQPPASDWALMIADNRVGLPIQPWVIIVPALLIAALTIAVNLVADAIARSLGTSIEGLEGEAGGR